MLSLGFLCFPWTSCVATGLHVFPLDFMCFHWTSCVATGLRVFPLDFLCFHWTSCVSTGLRVFPLDFVCFHWTSCVSTGLHVFSRGNACFSQPTLLGINVGLTIKPLDQPTATFLSACRVCKQLFRLPTLSLRVKTAKAVLLQVHRILVYNDERSVWER